MLQKTLLFLVLTPLFIKNTNAQDQMIYLSTNSGNAAANGTIDYPIDYMNCSKNLISTPNAVSLILLTDNEIYSINEADFLYDFTNITIKYSQC